MKEKHGVKVSNNTENQKTIFICKSIYKMNFLLIQQTSRQHFSTSQNTSQVIQPSPNVIAGCMELPGMLIQLSNNVLLDLWNLNLQMRFLDIGQDVKTDNML